jgi:hypothetical protein
MADLGCGEAVIPKVSRSNPMMMNASSCLRQGLLPHVHDGDGSVPYPSGRVGALVHKSRQTGVSSKGGRQI